MGNSIKLIIAGSRNLLVSDEELRGYLRDFTVIEIISGGASGIDTCAENYAKKFDIPYKVFPADWSLGKKAGPLRNEQMAAYADALLLIWDGESRGSASMRNLAIKYNLLIKEVVL